MRKSKFFVAIQFICILLLLPISRFYGLSLWSFIQLLAFFLGLVSLYESQKSRFSIFPEVKQQAILLKTGPYRIIRHPMYTSILLFFIPTLINNFTLYSLFVYLILLIDLVLKLHYEERLLMDAFSNYAEYKKETFKLVPFLY